MDVLELKETEILLVTGIANPTPLVNYLKSQKIKLKHLEYPDHYDFKASDISKIEAMFNTLSSTKKIILTTEKDYVRIFDKIKKVYVIAIKTTFLND